MRGLLLGLLIIILEGGHGHPMCMIGAGRGCGWAVRLCRSLHQRNRGEEEEAEEELANDAGSATHAETLLLSGVHHVCYYVRGHAVDLSLLWTICWSWFNSVKRSCFNF